MESPRVIIDCVAHSSRRPLRGLLRMRTLCLLRTKLILRSTKLTEEAAPAAVSKDEDLNDCSSRLRCWPVRGQSGRKAVIKRLLEKLELHRTQLPDFLPPLRPTEDDNQAVQHRP